MGDRRQAYRVLVGGPGEKRYHLEGLGICRQIILKRTLKKWDGKA
jgi:hypothetical protein